MRNTLVICDPETEYAKRLMEFINGKKTQRIRAAAFDSFEAALRYIRENRTELLLLSERYLDERAEELNVRKIIILTDEPDEKIQDHDAVYKYLPADRILREAESAYDAEMRLLKGTETFGSGGALPGGGRIYAVYSPVGGSGKTSLALALGLELSRSHRVLYLNLECCPGLPAILGVENERTLSDLIYLARQDPGGMMKRLPEMVVTIGNLDCILPAGGFEDMACLRPGEWRGILERILSESSYDIILIEPAGGMQDFLDVLKACTGIFMPCRSDAVSEAKIGDYERQLIDCGAPEILEKTVKLRVPFYKTAGTGKKYYEDLSWSELGDCARDLIRKESIA